MAYAAIVSLSQTLLEHVTDQVDQQQIKSLHEKLCVLQSFMEDCAYDIAEKVDPLEKRIREAAYEAADVVELHILNRIRSDRSLVFKCGQMQNLEKRYKKDLKRLNESFDSIVEEATKIKTNETPMIPRRTLGVGSSPISSRSTVVGINDDLQEMKARLCWESPKRQIISIVGMGGIGKTTLARTIFDDSLIAEHFDFRAWITVSQEYCMRDILLGLLNSLNAALTNDLSKKIDKILALDVYQSLKGKRYLFIMDDVWSTKAWDDMRRILPNDNNGSRIVMTTRLSEVATYADSSSPPQQMQLLNEDQSWSLLQNKVFGKELCPPKLEKIGKIIAEKCGGLPLGIILVAGILSKVDATLNYWEQLAVNVSSTLATNDDHLFKILSLSYNNLPHHLRACFLYMGGFPEDQEILISQLTMLWTAEGFLKPIRSKSSEEMGEECVVDLVERNLVSITKKGSNGRFKFCRIHDLLRDFCIQKAHDENFLHVIKNRNTTTQSIQNKHRLCNLVNGSIPTETSDSFLRSHLFSNNNHWYLTSLAISSRLLRLLDGPNVYLTCIPAAVTELFHLRYLAFSHDYSVQFVVPPRIFKLINLQTLIIGPQYRYSQIIHFMREPRIHLPPEIWKMPKLRHLILNNCYISPVTFSTNLDRKISVLENLQTLTRVANFSFAKEVIEIIPNLKKLGVIYDGKGVMNPPMIKWSMYHLNNLFRLHQLESLNLTCNVQSTWRHWQLSPLTKNFALPPKLKKLTLTGCRLSWRNLSMIARLSNLEVLKLRSTGFEEKEWKSTEGEFLQMKYLLMDSLDVECWQVEEHTHFRSLEHLIIRHCSNLKEIPSEIGDVPTLQSIEIISELASARNSVIRIQEEQLSNGNNSLKVHVFDPWPKPLV